MKFFTIPVGDTFYIEQERPSASTAPATYTSARKVSALGYNLLSEGDRSEYSIDPITDGSIVTQAEMDALTPKPANKPAKKVAKKTTKPKQGAVRKASGRPAKKPAKKVAKKRVG